MPRERSHAARLAALAAALLVLATPTPAADSETGRAPPAEPALPERGADVEQLVLETEDGLKLGASFYLPDRKHGRAPAVLIAHGPDGDRAQVATLAEQLRKKGFAVLAVDLRGHGQSAAGKPWSELERAERERMWTFALRDLGAAAAFLRARRDIHTTNLTVVGVGGAAALALRHAAGDENARAVVLIAPSEDQLGFNLPDEMQRCGGLPALVVASRDGRAMAKRFVDGMQSTGVAGLELAVLRSGDQDYLRDSKMPDRVATFLRQVVVERKGR